MRNVSRAYFCCGSYRELLSNHPCDFSLIHVSASASFSNPKIVSTSPPRHMTLTECPLPIAYWRTEFNDMRQPRDKVARHYGRRMVQFTLSLPAPDPEPKA